LLKTLGKKFGKQGSTTEGVKIVQDFWKNQGIDQYALDMIDGSGLSPQNRITADDLVRVLLFAKKQPWFDDYFKGFPVINGIKMKSGSIKGVISYTGFISGKGGNYVFAFIVNNYNDSGSQMRRKMWSLLDLLK
jgi:D-alanyl-D-alanine carboxypeptidase/D-alanyl-D-alanine-endopeptidase (penicillin-binding protein 4)